MFSLPPQIRQPANDRAPQEQIRNQSVESLENIQPAHMVLVPFNRMAASNVLDNIRSQWRKTFTFKDKTQSCSVCLEKFKQGEDIIELHCDSKHIFHPDCIEDWARINRTCPLCRIDIFELARNEENGALPAEHAIV
jgi:hypothetical protein